MMGAMADTSVRHDSGITIGPAPSGRGFRLEAAQFLPHPRERIFEFFSDAVQLEALTPAQLNEAAKLLSTTNFTWIIVGDRKIVEPQLKQLGLPIEVR